MSEHLSEECLVIGCNGLADLLVQQQRVGLECRKAEAGHKLPAARQGVDSFDAPQCPVPAFPPA